MMSNATARRRPGPLLLVALFSIIWAAPVQSQEAQESAFVRLLKGGKVPDDRQGTIVDMIGKRGSDGDLAFIFQRATEADGFAPAVRKKALAALVDAALTRKVKPSGDLKAIGGLLRPGGDAAQQLDAIKLAALWNEASAAEALKTLVEADATDDKVRAAALDAYAATGGDGAKAAIVAMAKAAKSINVRALAVGSLAKFDPAAAVDQASAILHDAGPKTDLQPVLAAFLGRQDGADKLVAAIEKAKPSPDVAKLALRALYALGRADAPVVAALSKAAGIEAEVKPLSQPEMDKLVAEIHSQGDPIRGEDIFRRAELNCAKCHALGGAGGGIGPELSPIGGSSPPDYIVNALILPDQAIKEEYHTLIALTTDGQILQGIVVDKDDKRIVLKDATGELRTVPTDEIDDSKEGGSLMPKGLSNLMTRGEFVDLLRFLTELGKPGRFALPTTPVLVKWQVLQGAPDSLVAGIPEAIALRSEVLDADSARWLPYFAHVGGHVPLKEIAEIAGSPVIYLKGEIEVNGSRGRIAIQPDATEGVTAWVDDQVASPTDSLVLDTGRHAVIVRVDTAKAKASEIKVEVTRPTGSSAEFAVIGGK